MIITEKSERQEMNREINYSIIIPHKNIPKLLQRCLDSIPRREDVQIIVVDDNSDSNKVDFEHFPGLGDPLVEVIFTKEGKGAGYARNVGLTKAIGKWLLFADADDFYNYCISDVLDEYVDSDADIIYFKHNSLDSDMYTITHRCAFFDTYIDYWLYSNKKADYFLRYKHTSVWTKLFRKEFIVRNCILFDEVYKSNDVTFAYLAGFFANSINVDSRAIYCTTLRQGSIRHSKVPIEKRMDAFYVSAKRYRFFRKHGILLSDKIFFVKTIIKSFFFNKTLYNEAMNVLFSLGFTSSEIIGLCIYTILIYVPLKIVTKLSPNNSFLPIFFLNSLEKFIINKLF